MTIVGTRPELIRMALCIRKFDEIFSHFLVHTGQNADTQLSDVFFSDLDIRHPDKFLGVDNSSLGKQLSGVIQGTESLINSFRPDALVVLGDTNSSMAAVIAKRMGVIVYHLEAGNRSFDANVPEEINRRLVDHVSDFNLVYSEHARSNLLREGIQPRFIGKSGSPIRELADHFSGGHTNSNVLDDLGLERGRFLVASLHRQENIDFPDRCQLALETLSQVASHYNVKLVVSTHPRLRDRLEQASFQLDSIVFNVPFGFWDYLNLQRQAMCVISDSGSVSEESAIFGFPAVTMRDSMERPEALESATAPMVGLEFENVIEGIDFVTSRKSVPCPPDYYISDFSDRVTNFIVSSARRRNFWLGIRTSSEN